MIITTKEVILDIHTELSICSCLIMESLKPQTRYRPCPWRSEPFILCLQLNICWWYLTLPSGGICRNIIPYSFLFPEAVGFALKWEPPAQVYPAAATPSRCHCHLYICGSLAQIRTSCSPLPGHPLMGPSAPLSAPPTPPSRPLLHQLACQINSLCYTSLSSSLRPLPSESRSPLLQVTIVRLCTACQ